MRAAALVATASAVLAGTLPAEGLTPSRAPAQTAPDLAPLAAGPSAQPPEARRALESGLDWLARAQAEGLDGSLPVADAAQRAPVAVTALAALAWMAGGTTPERGEHGEALAAAIDYLLGKTDLTPGSPRLGYVGADGDELSRMHGHGFATLALAEAYTASPRSARGKRLKQALTEAVALIERTQGTEGGWYYDPRRESNHEGSITIALVQALRAAKAAGVRVDPDVVARAESYVERSQNEDGRFRYSLHIDQTSVALTAAAIATLNAAGTYEGDAISSGTKAIWRDLDLRLEGGGEDPRFPYYERLYLAQAFWQHHEEGHFDRWWPRERALTLADQRPDGSWGDPEHGDAYATAMNCLVLALPEAVLPAFQR
jgi:hypothetical protein